MMERRAMAGWSARWLDGTGSISYAIRLLTRSAMRTHVCRFIRENPPDRVRDTRRNVQRLNRFIRPLKNLIGDRGNPLKRETLGFSLRARGGSRSGKSLPPLATSVFLLAIARRGKRRYLATFQRRLSVAAEYYPKIQFLSL